MWRRTELRFREILAPLMPATRILNPDFLTPEDAEGVCCQVLGSLLFSEGVSCQGRTSAALAEGVFQATTLWEEKKTKRHRFC